MPEFILGASSGRAWKARGCLRIRDAWASSDFAKQNRDQPLQSLAQAFRRRPKCFYRNS
jgi:hypothetical protein